MVFLIKLLHNKQSNIMRPGTLYSKKEKYFSTLGWTQDFLQEDRTLKMYKELSPILSCNKKLNVLDVGSGDGTLINFLQSKFPQHIYFGCDISKEAIQKNKKEKPSISWKRVDFNYHVPFNKNFFDVIIAGEIIEHLYNTDNFFREIRRILNRDGILLLTTPNLASWMNRLFLLFGFQPYDTEVSDESHIFGKEFIYDLMEKKTSQALGHLRCFTKKALHAVLKHYHFKVLKEISCHIQPWVFNRFITQFFPSLSETQMVMITKKPLSHPAREL